MNSFLRGDWLSFRDVDCPGNCACAGHTARGELGGSKAQGYSHFCELTPFTGMRACKVFIVSFGLENTFFNISIEGDELIIS